MFKQKISQLSSFLSQVRSKIQGGLQKSSRNQNLRFIVRNRSLKILDLSQRESFQKLLQMLLLLAKYLVWSKKMLAVKEIIEAKRIKSL